ncbi:MAG TPA: putative manganese-dependent inorganic diphosphatase [Solirubrobacteraceae bacterium]
MSVVYVTGHRNPDTDSIAAAIGYAELRGRLDADDDYVPVRLGDVNAQTRWVLERAGADEPRHLPHVMLRVRDIMQEDFVTAHEDAPVREVGLLMAQEGLDVVPVQDGDGRLVGVVTERALARRFVRESREASSLVDAPASAAAIAQLLDGEIVAGGDRRVAGRVWVYAMEADYDESGIAAGDAVVIGNREEVQRRLIDVGVDLLVVSNGIPPSLAVRDHAEARDTTVIASPLDSYVSGRMITLAAPCRTVMDREPATVRRDDLMSDVAELVKGVHYRAAVVVDNAGRPVGLVGRADLVNPTPRRVLLVDHAEQAQSVPGIEQAEIVEILDHHHVGSIETRVPVRATFDPVGSTATLVVERFRQNGMEPSRPTATVLLGAVLSDTVILNSPTTTERDRAVVTYLERVLSEDHEAFGREMFEAGSDVAEASAEDIVARDAKEYEVGPVSLSIAQVETVGAVLEGRTEELREALERVAQDGGHALAALMVTDIMAQGTTLLAAGDTAALERAFDGDVDGGVIDLPGVMSRKKQLAPRLLRAF